MKRKRITMTIAVTLMVMLSGMLRAQVSVWDGSAEPWTHGSGTEEDPYLIESAANLAWLAKTVDEIGSNHYYKDTCFLLTVDLDLNGDQGLEWMPIGVNAVFLFDGHFDGGNHTIDNMRITLQEGDDKDWTPMMQGLFGAVEIGSICNVTMGERCLIIGDNKLVRYVGMLVGWVNTYRGYTYSPWAYDVLLPYRISGCQNLGNISLKLPDNSESISEGSFGPGLFGVGGLVGFTGTDLQIEGCSNAGTVSLEMPMGIVGGLPKLYLGPSIGGLVGLAWDEITGHYCVGDGVFVGAPELVVEDCHNTGNLFLGLDLRSYQERKRAYAGGIIGNAGYRVSVNHCSNRGDVKIQIGTSTGLSNYDPMLFCSGIIGGYGNDFHIISWDHNAIFNVNVTNCYNHASVRCEVEEGLAVETTVSGISGCAISESELVPELYVSNCYHVGELIADEANGVTPADTLEVLEVTNSYYLEGNAPDNGIGTPKTDEEMKSQAFVDLLNGDGPVTFYMDQWQVNDGYPVLDDKSPFLDGSEWYYEIQCDDGSVYYQYLRCAGDTTVNSHKTKVVVRTNQIYDKESVEVTHEYLYEEDNVVYWWNRELEEFTVLYVFGAEVGDEWETKVGRESITVHVDAEKPYYDPNTGRTYRMLVVSDTDDVFSGEIICGVGHTTSLFPEKLMSHKDGFAVDGLRCYWNNHELVLHMSTDDCDAIYSEVHGVEENGTATFVVYPNPTDGHLFVILNTVKPSSTYHITNVLGQTLMSGTLTKSSIDVSALPNGLYFLTVDGQTVKLMKQ